ncbi:MAG TPA: secretin N-terminal domain-containing protein, partial [Thermoanaerobaculia bacterium]
MKSGKLAAVVVMLLVLGGCSSYRAFEKARDFEVAKNWDQAVEFYLKALELDPTNKRYITGLQNAKLEASRVHFAKGKAFRAADQPALAALEFELVVKLDPTNQFALVELASAVEEAKRREAHADENTIEARKKRAEQMGKAQPPQLDPASDEPISLLFPRPTPVKEIYRALGNAFGINILFDQQLKDDQISIELRDVTALDALERVMQAGGHFYKILDARSIIVIPDNPQARREYEDLVIQTFYLSNGDAEQVTNIVRTMLEARYVYPLKALNAITIRDTADKVRIAKEIIEANDKAKAEVVVAVELLQLDVSKARDIGLQLITGGALAGGFIGSDGKPLVTTTLEGLRNLTSDQFSFNLPSVAYGFVKSNTDAQLLAKPQLRISEGEQATLHIGQRVPLPVSTFTSANPAQGGTYAPVTSYTYNDVGIKIAIEPRVHHNREVTLKLKVEVSNIAGYAPDTNPPQPVIGTRTIESIIRLKDGETNFLAGLIREDDSTTRSAVPFLGELPLIGRLFARDDQDFARTDLVLTMTPHIIRIANITEDDLSPMWVGTGTNITFRGASPRVESGVNADPFGQPASQFNAPPPAPTEPVSQPTPIIAVPPIQTPTDIFARPQVQPPAQTPPPPQPPVDQPMSRNPQAPPPAPQ